MFYYYFNSWEPTEERSRREIRSRRPTARSELALLLPTKQLQSRPNCCTFTDSADEHAF